MKRLLRKLFPSLFPATEYVCASAEDLPCMLKCVAVVDARPDDPIGRGNRIDLEKQPLFLGYKPLVMGVCEASEIIHLIPEDGEVIFEYLNIKTGEKVAELKLRVDKIIPVEDRLLVLLVGIAGNHKFETKLERLAFRINQRLTKKSPSNIDLDPAGYEMLKIAYSIPRSIRGTIVSLSMDTGMNVFPTDLHGSVAKNHFVLSLRKEKPSCKQVEEQKTFHSFLIGTDTTSNWQKLQDQSIASRWYKLGKNHSIDYQPVPYRISPDGTKGYTPGVPMDAVYVNEFKPKGILADYGIHRILLLEDITQEPAQEFPKDYLVHVHRSYANWHKRQGFPLKEIPH